MGDKIPALVFFSIALSRNRIFFLHRLFPILQSNRDRRFILIRWRWGLWCPTISTVKIIPTCDHVTGSSKRQSEANEWHACRKARRDPRICLAPFLSLSSPIHSSLPPPLSLPNLLFPAKRLLSLSALSPSNASFYLFSPLSSRDGDV